MLIKYKDLVMDRKEMIKSIMDVYIEYRGEKYRNFDKINRYILMIYPEKSVGQISYSSGIWFKPILIRESDGKKFNIYELFEDYNIKIEFGSSKVNDNQSEVS